MNKFCKRFDPKHLKKLKHCIQLNDCPQWQQNRSPHTFVTSVFDNVNNPELINLNNLINREHFVQQPVNRNNVWDFVNRQDNPLEKVLYVLAWGGMTIPNAQLALQSYSGHWEPIVESMLDNAISDFEAYSKFHRLRINGNLPGMGPAFFTKLIFFLGQLLNSPGKGYIMDQWLAKSINLLRRDNANQIALAQNGYVDNNGVDIYETFCDDLEALAKCLKKTPEKIEIILFSKRGCCWREYVGQHG